MEKMFDKLKENVFLPEGDRISVIILKDLIEKLYAKQSKRIYYENFIRHENEDFMFLSDINLFMTILLSKRNDLKSVLCEIDWKFMICNRESYNDLRSGKVDIV